MVGACCRNAPVDGDGRRAGRGQGRERPQSPVGAPALLGLRSGEPPRWHLRGRRRGDRPGRRTKRQDNVSARSLEPRPFPTAIKIATKTNRAVGRLSITVKV